MAGEFRVKNGLVVGTESPSASAIIQADSTSQGILPPRMTTAQRDAISSPATGLVIFNTDDSELQTYDSVGWVSVGSGAGTGRTNHLSGDDSTFKNSTGSWAGFADAAASTPADLTGGTPTYLTFARNTTAALGADGADLKISHDGLASGQGEGLSIAVATRNADYGLVQEISFEYQTDTNYADDDLEIWVYDVTNGVVIQPVPYKLKATQGLPNKFKAYFQAASDSASYRVGFYRASSSTPTAFDVQVDNVLVGPPQYNFGVPATDTESATVTLIGSTNGLEFTNYTATAKRQIIGDRAYYEVMVTFSGTPGTGTGNFIIKFADISIDTAKLASSTAYYQNLGNAEYYDATGAVRDVGTVLYYDANGVAIATDTVTSNAWSPSSPITWTTSDRMAIKFDIPVAGKSANVRMSDDADTREVSARWYISGAQTINTGVATAIDYDTKVWDTHNAGSSNGTNWTYTAPVTGHYSVSAAYSLNDTTNFSGTTENYSLEFYINGGSHTIVESRRPYSGEDYPFAVGTALIPLTAGDALTIVAQQTSGANIALVTGATLSYVTVHKIQGPSAIAASEKIYAMYEISASTANSSIANITNEIVDFDTKIEDSHGAVTTGASWKFTAPRADVYNISAFLTLSTTAAAAGNQFLCKLFKNGSQEKILGADTSELATTSLTRWAGGSALIKLNAGDYIDIQAYHQMGTAENLSTTGDYCHVSIHSIGGIG